MRISWAGPVGLAVVLQLVSVAARALAQPALERVEERLRREAEERPALPNRDAAPAKIAEAGYLGLLADDRAEQGRGVRVIEVVPGGPADKAGLEKGDLITAIDGHAVRRMSDFAQVLERSLPGKTVQFQISRDGVESKTEVVLGRRPAANDMAFPKFGLLPDESPDPGSLPLYSGTPTRRTPAAGGARLGVRTVPITEQGRRDAKPALLPAHGALVSFVTQDSPAAAAGIPLGAVITDVDGQRIEGPQELAAAIRAAEPGREITLSYHYRDKDVKKHVTLDGGPVAAPADRPGPAPEAPPQELPGPAPEQKPAPKRLPPNVEAPRPAPDEDEAMDQLRIDFLERRIRQLEARIEKLESAQRGANK